MRNKYPNGYMPKIKYYADIISEVAKSQRMLDADTLDKRGVMSQIDLLIMLQDAAASLDYFISKEHMRLNLKK
jgi:hypothetical protein